eukprot:1137003-Pelagomonas_calceolata.AAC.2
MHFGAHGPADQGAYNEYYQPKVCVGVGVGVGGWGGVTISRKENGLGRSRASFKTDRPSLARSLSL